MDNQQSLISITELLKNSWEIYKERFKVFIGIISIPIFIYILMGIYSVFINKIPFFISLPLIFTWIIIVIIVGFWSSLALIFAIKDRKENIGIKESFKRGKPILIPFAWVSFLTAIVLFGGFLLFIIPGIIFTIWFLFAPYILVSEGTKGMKALFRSKDLVRGKWFQVFWRIIIIFIVFIIFFSIISRFLKDFSFISGIITFLISPFLTVYYFLLYEDLKRIKNFSEGNTVIKNQ